MFDLPHHRARALLQTGAPVYLSVNPVEYHGPHLSLHNDSLISAGMIREMHAGLQVRHPDWPLIVARDLEIGVDPASGPGSRSTSLRAARRLIRQALSGLVEMGAQRVVLMTFHGSPLHSVALEAGVSWLRSQGVQAISPMSGLLWELVRMDADELAPMFAPVADPADREALRAWAQDDVHGGFIETSMTLYYAPESVSPQLQAVKPCPPLPKPALLVRLSDQLRRWGFLDRACEVRLIAMGIGWSRLRPFPGYTGLPHLANPASGAWLAKRIIAAVVDAAEEIFAGGPPLPTPPLHWLGALTLDGMIPRPDVPVSAIDPSCLGESTASS
ncbi:MAG: creatininase family protein [Myxococcota bacterium]